MFSLAKKEIEETHKISAHKYVKGHHKRRRNELSSLVDEEQEVTHLC